MLTPAIRHCLVPLLAASFLGGTCRSARGVEPSAEYLAFIRQQAADLRKAHLPPRDRADWEQRQRQLRQRLEQAWGGFPETACPLEPRKLGELQREGYRVEKIVFQTRPGVWMTANAYVPESPGKHPAILMVHGHWRGAKQDPVVQARCIGAAKLGFFVLAVDAFGAGERAVGEALGEYHGEMTGATLLPIGMPLSGLQVYENMRAADYLRSRPEVDGELLGITGASGGGNQSMYAGAWDERFSAVAPVCSIGTYNAYLGIACCMCEVVPGALTFTEEAGVLGLTAPRGLLVISATQDAFQFSVGQAELSVAAAAPIFQLLDRPDHLRHAIFEAPHAYNQPMREAMYGWMTRHLKGEGVGHPIPEPPHQTEDPEALRCYPGDTRPDDWMTIPRFAAAQARALLAGRTAPPSREAWEAHAQRQGERLIGQVFGGFPPAGPLHARTTAADGSLQLQFEPEPGLHLTAQVESPDSATGRALILSLEGAEEARKSAQAAEYRRAGWSIVTLDLRATGTLAWPQDRIAHAPDHNSAEWALWIGRPLLGQWVWDVRRCLDALSESLEQRPPRLAVCGLGPGGLVALAAAAVEPRITDVQISGTLASFVTEVPYREQRLGTLAPGIIRHVGDVAELAALVAPRPLVISGGVSGTGQRLTRAELDRQFEVTRKAYELLEGELKIEE